jgi:hypothetical protein
MALEDAFFGAMLGGGLGVLAGVALVLAVIIVIALYLYSVAVVRSIAHKTKVGPKWLAWIPVANLVLLLKAAKLQWQWIFAIFLPVIPFIGSALLMVGTIYVWWKVCKAVRKPEWLAILMIVPFVNLVAMGYIAWAK